MKWRIYRLPGSRKIWHIDSGPGTKIINVLALHSLCPMASIDVGCGYPRAWFEVHGELLVNPKTATANFIPRLEYLGDCSEVPVVVSPEGKITPAKSEGN